jgi:hypothetical protein
MTGEPVTLQHDVYRCGALFYGALAQYFAALNNDAADEVLREVTLSARRAGEAYNAALVALFKHLQSLPSEAGAGREAERLERAISILSFEIQYLSNAH